MVLLKRKNVIFVIATAQCVFILLRCLSLRQGIKGAEASDTIVDQPTNSSDSLQSTQELQTDLSVLRIESKNGIHITKRVISPGTPAHVKYEHGEKRMEAKIEHMLKREKKVCATSDTSLCPCVPPDLKGRMLLDLNLAESYSWQDVSVIAKQHTLGPGGTWHPTICQARIRIVIIIPFRERWRQLRAFLAHMHPILQLQQLDYRILVVEQNEPLLFNKAALMNAGFKEAMSREWKFDCVMFHDVDLMLEDDRNLLKCGKRFHHYGAYLDRYNYKAVRVFLFGGVVSMTPKQFVAVNGFSNSFFGWGGEDDNMYYRIVGQNFTIYRPSMFVNRYSTLKHVRDSKNPVLKYRRKHEKVTRPDFDEGLSTVNYTIISEEIHPLYTHIKIDINVTGLNYPEGRQTSLHYQQISNLDCTQNLTIKEIQQNEAQQSSLVATCMDRCSIDDHCESFTLHEDSQTQRKCMLKSRGCSVQAKVSPTSTLYLKGVDFTLGALTRHYQAHETPCSGEAEGSYATPSVMGCARLCSEDAHCGGFEYVKKSCRLKHECIPAVGYDHRAKSYIKA